MVPCVQSPPGANRRMSTPRERVADATTGISGRSPCLGFLQLGCPAAYDKLRMRSPAAAKDIHDTRGAALWDHCSEH